MGWRQRARSDQARKNRIIRSTTKNIREIEKEASRISKQAEEFEKRAAKAPINTIKLSYQETDGFRSDPFEITSTIYTASLRFVAPEGETPDDPASPFSPAQLSTNLFDIIPLKISVFAYGITLAVQIISKEPSARVTLDILKKKKDTSPFYLHDPVNNEYYYAIDSDLKGDVLAGYPKTGIVVFEPCRKPTSTLKFHVADWKPAKGCGALNAETWFASSTMKASMEEAMESVPFAPALLQEIQKAQTDNITSIERNAQRQLRSGCGCMVLLVGLALMTSTIAWAAW